MAAKKNERTLEDNLKILKEKSQAASSLSLEEIMDESMGKGRLLLLILLSLPFCQPLQIPGFSTPFGIAIAFIGLRIAFGKRVWLPKSVLKRRISADTIAKIVDKSLVVIRKMHRFIHPRLQFLCRHGAMQIVNGLLLFVLGLFLALPLPIPLSNLSAGWGIFLLSFGLLEDDGVLVIASYCVALLTVLFLIGMLFSLKYFATR
jgi:hypothetical protein